MGVAKLNIFVSGVADACSTWTEEGMITVFDCNGILTWPCGRYLAANGKWLPVPNGTYQNLPFQCGHLEVELPPGCYWVVAGIIRVIEGHVHLNRTTHVGIVQLGCGDTGCVKLFNPTLRLCWNWFRVGLQLHAASGQQAATGEGGVDAAKAASLEKTVEELLKDVPRLPIEDLIESHFGNLVQAAKGQTKKK